MTYRVNQLNPGADLPTSDRASEWELRDLSTKCQWQNAIAQNPNKKMLAPALKPKHVISGISYIGVLSVAFRPDNRTEKNGSIFQMFCLMMITHIWSWWTLVQVVSNSMIWAIFSLIQSMRLDFWWGSWESLVLMNEWELAGLRRTNEWIAMVKKCSVTS